MTARHQNHGHQHDRRSGRDRRKADRKVLKAFDRRYGPDRRQVQGKGG